MPLRRGHAPQPPEQRPCCQNGGHALAQKRGPGHAANAHVKTHHEHHVHNDVRKARSDEEIQRRAGIAQRREHARANIVQKQKRQPADIDIQIELGIRKHIFRRAQQAHQRLAEQKAAGRKQRRKRQNGNNRGRHRSFHAGCLLRAEQLADDDRAARVAAQRHGHEDHCDGKRRAHGSQRIFAHKPARHHAVGHIIQLLEHRAQQHGDGEPPQDGGGSPLGHIGDQGNAPPLFPARARTAVPCHPAWDML